MRRTVRLALAALALVPAALQAQKPTAQSLFDKHAALVGGRPAFRAAMPRTETGKADISFAGIVAGYKRITTSGGFLMSIDVPGLGEILQGSDGTIVWSDNPQAGASKLPTADACEAIAGLKPSLWEAGTYKSAEVLDEITFEGKAAWPVKLVTSCGNERVLVFDKATGYRIGEKRTTPNGEVRSIFDAYKPFGAIQLPTRLVNGTPNGDIVITIESVNFDAVPASVTALPASVKALP